MTTVKDKDLLSIQEARDCVIAAKKAHDTLATLSQSQLNTIIKAISEAASQNAQHLAQLAHQETGFGNAADKKIKNEFAAKTIYNAIKDMPVVGILHQDEQQQVTDIGVSVGVICGIVPSTNPTSTVIFKSLIALKSGNSIVFAPHPNAINCITETVKIVATAAENAGCPKGAISCISTPTLMGTKELMGHPFVSLILATGGPSMVRSAYSSGKPAIGVGAGNGPAFIDKSADVKQAIAHIFQSKTFDNGTICASEQSIVVEQCMVQKVEAEIQAQGGYILDDQNAEKLSKWILRPNGTLNPKIVGQTAIAIAKLAGLENVPPNTKVLLAREKKVGNGIPFSQEKLAPILAYYVEEDVDKVLEKAVQILHFEGAGHTFSIHANDKDLVQKFALKVPASRILVNTPSALGGIGATTNLFPSLTLGCGAVGGSSSSNNIGPLDIINIKRIAYGVRTIQQNTTETCMIEAIVQAVLQKISQ